MLFEINKYDFFFPLWPTGFCCSYEVCSVIFTQSHLLVFTQSQFLIHSETRETESCQERQLSIRLPAWLQAVKHSIVR